ncbi:hypothetical protein [Caulobacter radicis]|uniref:hypothetical protein n=1 Tax=Caulobacter radicis TaxID=2172650 RepID=UPI00105810F4|nr:hypothetical protein [Caulobacter radicis]
MASHSYRRKFERRPPYIPAGGVAFALPKKLAEANAEEAVTISLICHRRLFGECYSRIFPKYRFSVSEISGVFILSFAETKLFLSGVERPGDIDLLIVPYEKDELILDQAFALEVKIVRASYERQGKSPNEFGFSQGRALLEMGFPYVGVAHLIVSDESPQEAWREMRRYEVLDQDGNVGNEGIDVLDHLPWMLVERVYGRLAKACVNDDLALLSAFVKHSDEGLAAKYSGVVWMPVGRVARRNPKINSRLLDAIGDFFIARPNYWFDSPSRDPRSEVPEGARD